MAKELKIDNLNLVLKAVHSSNGVSFVLKSCCKQVVNLHNPCPGETVGLAIPKCISANVNGKDLVFCVDTNDIVFEHQSLNVETEYGTSVVTEDSGHWLVAIKTDEVEHENKICVKNITIPITTDCLDEADFGQCINLNDISQVVCMEHCLLEILRVIWLDGPQQDIVVEHNFGTGPYTYIWDLPDGYAQDLPIGDNVLPDGTIQHYERVSDMGGSDQIIGVTVIDSQGCIAVAEPTLITDTL